MQLDRQAALESASWGLPQLMGFNASKLGYTNVDGMVQAFIVDEDAQLDGARRFIASNAPLALAFRQKVWPRVAFFSLGEKSVANDLPLCAANSDKTKAISESAAREPEVRAGQRCCSAVSSRP